MAIAGYGLGERPEMSHYQIEADTTTRWYRRQDGLPSSAAYKAMQWAWQWISGDLGQWLRNTSFGYYDDTLADEIQQRKVNNDGDLFSHATFLVLFEQFIALIVGRSPGPTPLKELLTVLAIIIEPHLNSKDKFGLPG
jgi:hypothetical protein